MSDAPTPPPYLELAPSSGISQASINLSPTPSTLTITGKNGAIVEVNMDTGAVTILSKDPAALSDAAKTFWAVIDQQSKFRKCEPVPDLKVKSP